MKRVGSELIEIEKEQWLESMNQPDAISLIDLWKEQMFQEECLKKLPAHSLICLGRVCKAFFNWKTFVRALSFQKSHNIATKTTNIYMYISSFPALKSLSLENIQSSMPSDIDFLPLLEKLTSVELISDRMVTDANIMQLANLETLKISDCDQISGTCFVHLKYLREVVLTKQPSINDTMLNNLKNVSKLEVIRCSSITEKGFLNFNNLRNLTIDSCKVNYAELSIPSLTHLKICDASRNALNNYYMRIRTFENLEHLWINSYNRMKLSIEFSGELGKLKKLTLERACEVSKDSMESIKSITELDLYSNDCFKYDYIRYLPNLKTLNLGGSTCYFIKVDGVVINIVD